MRPLLDNVGTGIKGSCHRMVRKNNETGNGAASVQ